MDEIDEYAFDGEGEKKRDEYQRKPVAENIIKLLSADIAISPMIIDGGWGTGKTEFCYKLINLIGEETSPHPPFTTVYIDAFKADHADDPLMTVLAAILAKFPKGEGKKLKDTALPLLGFGMKTAGKALVSWGLKQDAMKVLDDIDAVVEKATNKVIDSSVKALLDGHMNADKNMKALSDALAELAETQPMILFIDELDRCRPDFAVAMLETIKHIFDVKGVQFVLITNTDQLKASINHCYGSAVDAERYLDKFIGYSFVLPIVDISHAILNSQVHFTNSLKKSLVLSSSVLGEQKHIVKGFLEDLIFINNLSLREVEKYLKYLEVYQVLSNTKAFSKDIYIGYILLRLFGVFVFSFYKESIKIHIKNSVDLDEMKRLLGKTEFFRGSCMQDGVTRVFNPDTRDLVLEMLKYNTLSEEWHTYCYKNQYFPISFGDKKELFDSFYEVNQILALNTFE